MPIALITGATAGIGQATAQLFAQHQYSLILVGRRLERLSELAQALSQQYGIRTHSLPLDVRQQAAVSAAITALPVEWQQIDLLINNAGLARGLASTDAGDTLDWDEMIDTNIKGLLYMSRAVLPGMRARGQGQVVNVGSTAAKETYPGGNVYAATKHAVDALSQGMRLDLLGTGVRIGAVHPGMVETEFSIVRFHGDVERAKKVYENFRPLSPMDVAETIYWMVSAPSHLNLADVLLLPANQAGVAYVHRQPTKA